MAHKDFFVLNPFKYKTRMLTAGERISLSSGEGRLFSKIGWVGNKRPSPKQMEALRAGNKTVNEARAEVELPPVPQEDAPVEQPVAEAEIVEEAAPATEATEGSAAAEVPAPEELAVEVAETSPEPQAEAKTPEAAPSPTPKAEKAAAPKTKKTKRGNPRRKK